MQNKRMLKTMGSFAIEGIRQHPVSPQWVDNTPIETLKKAIPQPGHVYDSLAKIDPEETAFQRAGSTRPKLESPEIDSRKASTAINEIALMRSIMDCYFQEKDNREQTSLLALDKVKENRKAKLREEKAYLEESKKLLDTSWFSWIRWALFGTQAVGLAGWALTWLLTGGPLNVPAALPLLMLSLQRYAAVGSGLVELGDGYAKHYNNARRANMTEMNHKREELSDKMKAAQKEIQTSKEVVAEIMKQLSEIETKKYEASLNR